MEFPIINPEFSIKISKDWTGNFITKHAIFPAFHLLSMEGRSTPLFTVLMKMNIILYDFLYLLLLLIFLDHPIIDWSYILNPLLI